jgi:hypothetical protein
LDYVGIYSNIRSAGNGKQETNCNQAFSNGFMGKGVDSVVSTISLLHRRTNEARVVGGTRPKESKHECGSVLGITGLLFGVTLALMFMGPIIMVSDGPSENELACNYKIRGFQQLGYYSNSEQFRLALSYCNAIE